METYCSYRTKHGNVFILRVSNIQLALSLPFELSKTAKAYHVLVKSRTCSVRFNLCRVPRAQSLIVRAGLSVATPLLCAKVQKFFCVKTCRDGSAENH